MQLLLNHKFLALKIHAAHSSHLAPQTFSGEVLDKFADDNVLDGDLIETVRRKTLQKLTDLGSQNFRRIGDLEDDHGNRYADGET